MNKKSKSIAYLLWLFVGWLGVHRFYVGDIGMGLLQLFTCGGLGILWAIDLFILGNRVDMYNLKNSHLEVYNNNNIVVNVVNNNKETM